MIQHTTTIIADTIKLFGSSIPANEYPITLKSGTKWEEPMLARMIREQARADMRRIAAELDAKMMEAVKP